MKVNWLIFAIILGSACAAPISTVPQDKHMDAQLKQNEVQFAIEGKMPSLDGAVGWLNSKPLTTDDLRGKVVLVDFWTYTCINWLHTEPYVRAWAEKYKDKGLVVIGVHTPEFTFEKNVENVRWASKEMNVGYPVAIDSDYAIWEAFKNQYWPALYLIDAKGNIRYQQFGEGEYETSERAIQKLLTEAGNKGINTDLVSVQGKGFEEAADWNQLGTLETYVGYGRGEGFASLGGVKRDKVSTYSLPTRLDRNQWGLIGDWTVKSPSAVLNKANGRIAYRFHARDLHLILSPAVAGTSVRFRVFLDGHPPGDAHGIDIDDQGNGVIKEPRLYQLVRQAGQIADRQFEIEFLDAGVEAYAFTFG